MTVYRLLKWCEEAENLTVSDPNMFIGDALDKCEPKDTSDLERAVAFELANYNYDIDYKHWLANHT